MRAAASRAGKTAFAAPLLGAIAACVGSGSDVGPKFPALASTMVRGRVLAPNGNPVSSASVRVLGSTARTTTDPLGRFRLDSPPLGAQVFEVEGRFAGAVGAENLGRYSIATFVAMGRNDLPNPVVLPDLDAGVAASIPLGVPLAGEPDLVAPGPPGSTLALVFDDGASPIPTASLPGVVPPANATVRATSHPDVAFPLPLPPTRGTTSHAPLALFVDPPELAFAPGASLRFSNPFGFGAGAVVEVFALDPTKGLWQSRGFGAVDAGGATIAAPNVVTTGGLYALAGPCPIGGTTTLVGRVLDGAGPPGAALEGAWVVGPDGRSARTQADGTFAIADVCGGLPGTGNPFPIPLFAFAGPDHTFASATDVETSVPGFATDFGDLVLRARPIGLLRALAVRKGLPFPNGRIGFGSGPANFGFRTTTGAGGYAEADAAPAGLHGARIAIRSGPLVLRSETALAFAGAGGVASSFVFVREDGFGAIANTGVLTVFVAREDSGAPIQGALVFGACVPPFGCPAAVTDGSGLAVLFGMPAGPVLVTAGWRSPTNEGALPSGSGPDPVAERALVAYRSVASVNSRVVRIALPAVVEDIDRHRAHGRIRGVASGLTDPGTTPPSNPSGTYAVRVAAHAEASAADLWDVFREGTLDDGTVPAGDASVGFPPPPGSLDADYSVGAPIGNSALVGVERDSTDPDAGTVTRLAFAPEVAVAAGAEASAALAFVSFAPTPLALVAPGLDPGLAAGLEAAVGVSGILPSGFRRVVRFADFTAHLAPSGPDAWTLGAPPGSTGFASPIYLVRLSSAGPLLGGTSAQEAYLEGGAPALAGAFLAIPDLTTPPPGGGGFEPTTTGLAWNPPPGATVQRITLTRPSALSGAPPGEVLDDFAWTVDLPGTASSFVFPALPAAVGATPVPAFFPDPATPVTYEVRLEALSLDPSFHYGIYFANADAVRFSDFDPSALSRFETTVSRP